MGEKRVRCANESVSAFTMASFGLFIISYLCRYKLVLNWIFITKYYRVRAEKCNILIYKLKFLNKYFILMYTDNNLILRISLLFTLIFYYTHS